MQAQEIRGSNRRRPSLARAAAELREVGFTIVGARVLTDGTFDFTFAARGVSVKEANEWDA